MSEGDMSPLDVQDPGQPGDREDPAQRRAAPPEHEVAPLALDASMRGREDTQSGGVDQLDIGNVDDEIAVAGQGGGMQCIPDHGDASDIKSTAEINGSPEHLDDHVTSPHWRRSYPLT